MSRIGLGTAQLAFKDITAEQAIATVHAALDSGVRLIDTALAYTREGVESYAEQIVGRALAQRPGRREALVATKGGHYRDGDDFPVDASPEALRANCDTSLRNLGVDRIDLYQLHHVDPRVPLAESVGALKELQAAGKVAAIGLSNVSVAQIEQARAEAAIAAVQNRLSLADRADLPTVAYCAATGLRYLACLPLGGPAARRDDPVVAGVAARLGLSVPQVWLAWVLAQGAHVTPLVGASRPETIRQSAHSGPLAMGDLALIDQQLTHK
ncbi:aldo/keto reductase [Actinoplanes sp. TBRC 11911]|uniref:aldo/keto reductase n=1 Tax=Actinoplanes sp. TBRC 11911 TaxID=2729386 RepID=UPI0020071297|nr:aldo/keto reductase [Actinoplanes sp. TBRC 11911]